MYNKYFTSCPTQSWVPFLDHFQRRGLHFFSVFYPVRTSSLARILSLGGACFVTHCSCLLYFQQSLEMKIFGRIVPEWAKRLWIKEERGYFLQIEQTHSCRWEGEVALLILSPNLRFHREMMTLLDKDTFFFLHGYFGQVQGRHKKRFFKLILLVLIVYPPPFLK